MDKNIQAGVALFSIKDRDSIYLLCGEGGIWLSEYHAKNPIVCMTIAGKIVDPTEVFTETGFGYPSIFYQKWSNVSPENYPEIKRKLMHDFVYTDIHIITADKCFSNSIENPNLSITFSYSPIKCELYMRYIISGTEVNFLSIPKGGIEPWDDHSIVRTACREFHEETGCYIKNPSELSPIIEDHLKKIYSYGKYVPAHELAFYENIAKNWRISELLNIRVLCITREDYTKKRLYRTNYITSKTILNLLNLAASIPT